MSYIYIYIYIYIGSLDQDFPQLLPSLPPRLLRFFSGIAHGAVCTIGSFLSVH